MAESKAAFVVLAEFSVASGQRAEFLDLCAFDGLRSTADERDCHQFDLVTSPESPEAVILYEVYTDQAAFDHHLTTPHYATFAQGLDRLGVTKTRVRFLTRQ